MKSKIALIFLLLLSVGCQYDPYTSVYTKKKPKESDLIGRYIMTLETEKMVREKMNYPFADSEILIKGDGTFEIKNLPDCWATGFGDPGGKYDNGKGKWTLEKPQEWWVIGLHFENAMGITSVKDWNITIKERDGTVRVLNGKETGYGADAHLINEKPPYLIHFIVGDPDSGIGLQYQKTTRANQSSLNM